MRSITVLQVYDSFKADLWHIIVVEEQVCCGRYGDQDERDGEEEKCAQVCFDSSAGRRDIERYEGCRLHRDQTLATCLQNN